MGQNNLSVFVYRRSDGIFGSLWTDGHHFQLRSHTKDKLRNQFDSHITQCCQLWCLFVGVLLVLDWSSIIQNIQMKQEIGFWNLAKPVTYVNSWQPWMTIELGRQCSIFCVYRKSLGGLSTVLRMFWKPIALLTEVNFSLFWAHLVNNFWNIFSF